jgi:hypothetical protein
VGDLDAIVSSVRADFCARAAGLWRLDGDRLILLAFDPAPDMPRAVADGFVAATRSVPLDPTPLGIVGAATTRAPVISLADQLPPSLGSGRWLRAFGASRSVAVPLLDSSETVRAVLSIALVDTSMHDRHVVDRLREAGSRLLPLLGSRPL